MKYAALSSLVETKITSDYFSYVIDFINAWDKSTVTTLSQTMGHFSMSSEMMTYMRTEQRLIVLLDAWQRARVSYLSSRMNTELKILSDIPAAYLDGVCMYRKDDDRVLWQYFAGDKVKSWMKDQDRSYLQRIRYSNPARFMDEMTYTNGAYDLGLHQGMPWHRSLFKYFQNDVRELNESPVPVCLKPIQSNSFSVGLPPVKLKLHERIAFGLENATNGDVSWPPSIANTLRL